MQFQHSADIWRDFSQLVPGVLHAEGITADAPTGPAADRFAAIAKSRLTAVAAESELPEIQAWRRAFAQLGLKPTQYRCASESLLRRFRKEGSLPGLHPLVDLCNAVSLAFAIPVAVFDVFAVTGPLEVRSGYRRQATHPSTRSSSTIRQPAGACGQLAAAGWRPDQATSTTVAFAGGGWEPALKDSGGAHQTS
jgi:B3/4 domain